MAHSTRVGGACLLLMLLLDGSLNAQAVRTAVDGAPPLEVVSIKPSASPGPMRVRASPARVDVTGATLLDLIRDAYGEPAPIAVYRVAGMLPWMERERFDITAPLREGAPPLTRLSTQLAMRTVLRDRFKVSVRAEKREGPAYTLRLVKEGAPGAGLKPTVLTCEPIAGEPFPLRPCDAIRVKGGAQFVMLGEGVTMAQLAGQLAASPVISRPVIDRSGLAGRYDFTVTWAAPPASVADSPATDAVAREAGPSLFAALEDQLGIKLEAGRGVADVLVIEAAERPASN